MLCRFNFPQPPMRRTQILYPLEDDVSTCEKKKLKTEFIKLNNHLNNMKDGEDISIDDLLGKLGLSYILAIRSSLVTATIFLIVRSVSTKIVTNRVKAPNLAHLFLLTYQTNLEGVPCDLTFRGGKKLIAITQYPYTYMKATLLY